LKIYHLATLFVSGANQELWKWLANQYLAATAPVVLHSAEKEKHANFVLAITQVAIYALKMAQFNSRPG
jgi:predicted Zn-dependent protease